MMRKTKFHELKRQELAGLNQLTHLSKNLFTISANIDETRRKWPKKRSLFDINEYFEVIFNTVSTSVARSWTGSNQIHLEFCFALGGGSYSPP